MEKTGKSGINAGRTGDSNTDYGVDGFFLGF
jgi:hypothetical protein